MKMLIGILLILPFIQNTWRQVPHSSSFLATLHDHVKTRWTFKQIAIHALIVVINSLNTVKML